MSQSNAPVAQERVLSTLNADGTRRWIKPVVSPGRFWHRRRAVGYALIALFTLLPYLRINGKPTILLDIIGREFTLFGTTFYPTDTLPMALLVVSIFLGIFLLTALFGRVWCGWACPQTVYLEFIYRPIERLFIGAPGHRRKPGGWRKPAMYVSYLLLSMFLAHTFLAYFVGVDQLRTWIIGNPLNHPTAFLTMAIVTGLMMFDFAFFREQTCIVACPYGRFQSVLLDRASLIVAYDAKRGEPRGPIRRRRKPRNEPVDLTVGATDPEPEAGDCIDCLKCVNTCPTGIDIREGLQMECVHCAQCIDACDDVMRKVGRPIGLIRYSSQEAMEEGKRRFLRPRTVLYPTLLAVVVSLLVFTLATKAPSDVTVLRGRGLPFTTMPDGRVANQILVKVRNRTNQPARYTVGVPEVEGAEVLSARNPFLVEPGQIHSEPMTIVAPKGVFRAGHCDILVEVSDGSGFEAFEGFRLLGPEGHHEEDELDEGDDDG